MPHSPRPSIDPNHQLLRKLQGQLQSESPAHGHESHGRAAPADHRVPIAWKGLASAPVMIVVSVDSSRDPQHFVEDGAAAAQNLCLAAQSLGLGSSWAGVSDKRPRRRGVETALKKLVSLPRDHRIIAVIPIGHTNGPTRESSRIPVSEMVHHEQYGPLRRYRSTQ